MNTSATHWSNNTNNHSLFNTARLQQTENILSYIVLINHTDVERKSKITYYIGKNRNMLDKTGKNTFCSISHLRVVSESQFQILPDS